MGDVKLSTPCVVVVHRGYPDPLEIQTENPDMLLWERTRLRHKWPTFQDAPIMWLTFLSWAAAKRLGMTEETWEAWADNVRSVSSADEDNEQGTPFPAGEPDPADM